jgi:hypothetical protein
LPATFSFQPTDPATNLPTGTPDVPVDIPAGAAQTFVFAVTPTSEFGEFHYRVQFVCRNADVAPVVEGLDTLLVSASSGPVPDVVALAATASRDGIVDLTGPARAGAFAVATVNVGAAGTLHAVAHTNHVPLPLQLAVCQTQPATGECFGTGATSVTASIGPGETPTFAVFIFATGAVTFDPARHRVFLRFVDANGITRGATSVAVRTQ